MDKNIGTYVTRSSICHVEIKEKVASSTSQARRLRRVAGIPEWEKSIPNTLTFAMACIPSTNVELFALSFYESIRSSVSLNNVGACQAVFYRSTARFTGDPGACGASEGKADRNERPVKRRGEPIRQYTSSGCSSRDSTEKLLRVASLYRDLDFFLQRYLFVRYVSVGVILCSRGY